MVSPSTIYGSTFEVSHLNITLIPIQLIPECNDINSEMCKYGIRITT